MYVFDELKDKTMKALGFKTDDEYFKNLDLYLENLLAPEEDLLNIYEYIKTRDPSKLEMRNEMMIAKDMFGGYENAE